ncbi:MAG: hypothetical protein V7723_19655 [Sneathiella sp.]|uniref:hypothetical protein n=1 Tax=Sneathiella sp. TaxID=1964365 RepID=UPI003002D562
MEYVRSATGIDAYLQELKSNQRFDYSTIELKKPATKICRLCGEDFIAEEENDQRYCGPVCRNKVIMK